MALRCRLPLRAASSGRGSPFHSLGLAIQVVARATVKKHPRLAALAASVVGSAFTAYAAEPRFGDLPAGAISISETADVAAEICHDHLFDPTAATAKLPAGFRLILAEEASTKDQSLRALVQANPRLRTYALGSLCFASVGQFTVDGTTVQSAGSVAMAFWWASAEGPSDPNMRGKASWVQLGSWYSSSVASRSVIQKADPMAEFVGVDVERLEPNRWRLRLELPGETVTAEVTGSGRRVPSRASQPGFMSVPMSGPAAGYFSVFTYYGHHHQSAQGAWRASGSGVFSDALAITSESGHFRTVLQDGWSARAGLYAFRPK